MAARDTSPSGRKWSPTGKAEMTTAIQVAILVALTVGLTDC
jgi:hypothetical protein